MSTDPEHAEAAAVALAIYRQTSLEPMMQNGESHTNPAPLPHYTSIGSLSKLCTSYEIDNLHDQAGLCCPKSLCRRKTWLRR